MREKKKRYLLEDASMADLGDVPTDSLGIMGDEDELVEAMLAEGLDLDDISIDLAKSITTAITQAAQLPSEKVSLGDPDMSKDATMGDAMDPDQDGDPGLDDSVDVDSEDDFVDTDQPVDDEQLDSGPDQSVDVDDDEDLEDDPTSIHARVDNLEKRVRSLLSDKGDNDKGDTDDGDKKAPPFAKKDDKKDESDAKEKIDEDAIADIYMSQAHLDDDDDREEEAAARAKAAKAKDCKESVMDETWEDWDDDCFEDDDTMLDTNLYDMGGTISVPDDLGDMLGDLDDE